MTKEEAIKYLQQLYPNGGHCWLDEQRMEAIGMAINALQEEPVSKVWHYQKKEPVNEIADKSRPIIVVYGNNSLNAAGKFRYYEDNSDAIWLSNSYEKWAFVEDLINLTHSVTKVSWQEEPVSSIWHDASEPPIIDKTFLLVAPNGNSSLCLWGGKELHSVTIGGGHSVLCKGDIYSYIDDLLNLDNSCQFEKKLQEEPVSEVLDEAAFDYAEACKYDGGEKLLCVEHFKAGAKRQKEQMTAKAIDVEVKVDAGGYPYIPQMELYDYDKDIPLAKAGDRYKVILIKEE